MSVGRHVVVLATFFMGVAGCEVLAGVDFDDARLGPDGSAPLEGGPRADADGSIIVEAPVEAGKLLDGGSTSQCSPDPSSVTCAGRCGTVKDNCGADRACSTDCGSGQVCVEGRCSCKPDPAWCNGRCGATTDNCGAAVNCGGCAGGVQCTAQNTCGCAPEPATTTCGAKQCGTAVNNCGQTVTCGLNGQCAAGGAFCKPDQTCCTDNGAACSGRCGGVALPNNCGQSVGCPAGCSSGLVCVGTSCCTPEPLAVTCSGVPCGPKTNNCGQTVSCPNTCAAPQTCGGGGAGVNGCGCTPIANPCDGYCAGSNPDGCGNMVACTNDCGLGGECPCAGGTCTASRTCRCNAPPCL